MSSKEKTEWIMKAVNEIETLEDKLKTYRRKIINLNTQNQELKDENKHLAAQLGTTSNQYEGEQMDDERTPSPRTPHLSPVKTEDVIKSVKRRLNMTPRSPSRSHSHTRVKKGGSKKSRKMRIIK
jgi:predicted RNase H-like nuclease (RuvC/YqgF family)